MTRGNILISTLIVSMLILSAVGSHSGDISFKSIQNKQKTISPLNVDIKEGHSTLSSNFPSAIAISDSDPFYALIATPVAIHYNETGTQAVIPLYIKNFDNPSKAVERVQNQIGIPADYIINGTYSPKDVSLDIATRFWNESSSALIIEYNHTGYNFGVVATPLASYLSIPIIVANAFDQEVNDVLDELGVETVYVCGNITGSPYTEIHFHNINEIIDECIDILDTRIDTTVQYITIANPSDIIMPDILDTTTYHFNGTVGSSVVLPTQFINMLIKNNGAMIHQFRIPHTYKYTQLKIDLENLDIKNVETLGDRLYALLLSPDGYQYAYTSTAGSPPERDENGNITKDKIHFELTIYDEPCDYKLMVIGHWFGLKEGSYNATVTLEKLDSPIVPLMKNLSSIAPYLTAYHKGILFAKSDFAFAADDDVLYNGSTCPGPTQPGTNWRLIEPSNNHTKAIHDELNSFLADIAGLPPSDIETLREHYAKNPIYIAIVADPTMVPMYFYYNPDGAPNTAAHIMGFAVPSDFIYGDIDPKVGDLENDTYTYWPFQENIVGRVTGRDIQDCSALIARTIFYNNIIDDMGNWKNNALVQTGCGLEFQNLPFVTKLSQFLYSGRGEPTKFPTGESTFINMRLKSDMETGDFNTTSTMLLQSQREGFDTDELEAIKEAGILNRLLFPKNVINYLSSTEKVTGGKDQLNSSLIFAFAHGFYNLYEFGDILMDSRGFPFVTMFSRIMPTLGSRMSAKGSFDVRSLENAEYGPSVVFIESCITGRTDGMPPEDTLSQTYIHAGANTYIGSTRVTADPGYLDPRPLPGGVGIGVLGLVNATLKYKLKGEYPDLHFGAVIAEDFIIDLIKDNSTGLALRNAKNMFLPKDANSTFLWSPPLSLSSGNSIIDNKYLSTLDNKEMGVETRVLDKKYVALHEFVLYGDPAFNPYQPCNGG